MISIPLSNQTLIVIFALLVITVGIILLKRRKSTPRQVGGMDDPVAYQYYLKDHLPGILRSPELNKVDNLNVQTLPAEVNIFERFMDDKMALNYYSQDHLPVPDSGQKVPLRERFVDIPVAVASTAVQPPVVAPPAAITVAPEQTQPTQPVVPRERYPLHIVYSGDLIQVHSNDQNMPSFLNGLFKLRFQLAEGHQHRKLVPLRFQQKVHINYNDDAGTTQKLAYNNQLKPMVMINEPNTVFELINPSNPMSTDIINYDDEVVLRISGWYLKSTRETTDDLKNANRLRVVPHKGCGPLWRFK